MRLSFALSDWIALGRKYPKALETLRTIRDEKTARLLAGEKKFALFNDVESINSYLGEPTATVGLFKKIDSSEPTFATHVCRLVEKALVGLSLYRKRGPGWVGRVGTRP